MAQKTFHTQTAKFIAGIIENLPVLTDEEMQAWIEKPRDLQAALKAALGPSAKGDTQKPALMTTVGTIRVPAQARFVGKEHFTLDNKRVKFSYLSPEFRELLENLEEETTEETDLTVRRLDVSSKDEPMIAEIGEDKAVSPMSFVYGALLLQPKGGKGALLTNGYANIFWVRDKHGRLWWVFASWSDDGWDLDAHRLPDPHRWFGGRQVVSR